MNFSKHFRFLLIAVALATLPGLVSGRSLTVPANGLPVVSTGAIIDSTATGQTPPQDDKKGADKKKGRKKGDVQKPDIKEVPKAKRKIKPVAVKTKVKIPVKRVKPVIKRPLGLIRKNLVL